MSESQGEGRSDVGPVFTAERERSVCWGGRGGGHREDHWGLLDPSCCSEHRHDTHTSANAYTQTVIYYSQFVIRAEWTVCSEAVLTLRSPLTLGLKQMSK